MSGLVAKWKSVGFWIFGSEFNPNWHLIFLRLFWNFHATLFQLKIVKCAQMKLESASFLTSQWSSSWKVARWRLVGGGEGGRTFKCMAGKHIMCQIKLNYLGVWSCREVVNCWLLDFWIWVQSQLAPHIFATVLKLSRNSFSTLNCQVYTNEAWKCLIPYKPMVKFMKSG